MSRERARRSIKEFGAEVGEGFQYGLDLGLAADFEELESRHATVALDQQYATEAT